MLQLLKPTASCIILWLPIFIAFGIGLGCFYPLPPFYQLITVVIAFVSVILFKRHLIAAITFGIFSSWFSYSFQQVHLSPLITHSIDNTVIRGTVESYEKKATNAQVIVAVEAIEAFNAPLPQKLKVFMPFEWINSIPIHSKIEFVGSVWPLPKPFTPSSYPLDKHLQVKGIGGFSRLLYLKSITPSKPHKIISFLEQTRSHLSEQFYKHLSPYSQNNAAIADALLTGKRQDIDPTIRLFYTQAGIAHVLAISGLHLSLVAGFAFLLFRRLMVPFSFFYFQGVNLKKISAIGVIILSAFYVGISGFGYPALRAFVMIFMAMIGILLDKKGQPLRFLALSASAILLFDPYSLFSISFQLSFSAVLGLVAVYESQLGKRFRNFIENKSLFFKLTSYFVGITFSSIVATLATLAYTIVHFHQFTLQAILGNLIAIPLMGFWIMPLIFLCTLSLMVEGWQGGFYLLSKGISLLNESAAYVGSLPGAKITFSSPTPFFLPLFSLGFVLLCIMKNRKVGAFVLCVSLLFLPPLERPFALVSNQAKEIAYIQDDTLWMVKGSTTSFAAKSWQETWALKDIKKTPAYPFKVKDLFFYPYPFAYTKDLENICQSSSIVVSNGFLDKSCPHHLWKIDKTFMGDKDYTLIYEKGGEYVVDWRLSR